MSQFLILQKMLFIAYQERTKVGHSIFCFVLLMKMNVFKRLTCLQQSIITEKNVCIITFAEWINRQNIYHQFPIICKLRANMMMHQCRGCCKTRSLSLPPSSYRGIGFPVLLWCHSLQPFKMGSVFLCIVESVENWWFCEGNSLGLLVIGTHHSKVYI